MSTTRIYDFPAYVVADGSGDILSWRDQDMFFKRPGGDAVMYGDRGSAEEAAGQHGGYSQMVDVQLTFVPQDDGR